jgi:hypothetical protein
MVSKTAKEYTDNVLQALFFNHENLIQLYTNDEKGALRLAREYGYGLNDFPAKERDDMIHDSYSSLCVRFYDLKPPINAKEWIQEIKKMIN